MTFCDGDASRAGLGDLIGCNMIEKDVGKGERCVLDVQHSKICLSNVHVTHESWIVG